MDERAEADVLLGRLQAAVGRLAELAGRMPGPGTRVPGARTGPGRAAGVPWEIDAADARLILINSSDLLPLLVDPATTAHLTATIEVRLRGAGPSEPPIVLTFADGSLAVGPGPAPRADVRISAEPVAFLLISYGRLSQWRAIVTARVLAWGRRPWLALRLTRYLVNP